MFRWRVCHPSSYISVNGTNTSNQFCSDCQNGFFTDTADEYYCESVRHCSLENLLL